MKNRAIIREAEHLPTHIRNEEYDPDTDLDLHSTPTAEQHQCLSDMCSDQQQEQQLQTLTDREQKARQGRHYRSLSSSSHKYYRQSSCESTTSSTSSYCDTDSFSGSNSKSSKSRLNPDISSSSSRVPEISTCLTVVVVIFIFMLSFVLLYHLSPDIRSAIQINQLLRQTTSNSDNQNNSHPEETFNSQVTSRIISLILPDDSVIGSTESGSLLGFRVKELGRIVRVFLGIPYAKPPVGALRFGRPYPVVSWKGLRDATRFGHQCIQFKPNKTHTPWINTNDNMSEDCLTLNVWTPEPSEGSRRKSKPVMVWFHGGAFFSGSTDVPIYDGRTLAAFGDVVVVTVNYRLGLFGFLDAKTGEAAGNQGLYDQIMALEWVKANIRHFDGDPDSVTIFGQSAGAISVGLHYLSPLSTGLFKRGILQSGSPTVSRLFYERDPTIVDVKNKIPNLAVIVGCIRTIEEYTSANITSIVKCLKSADAETLSRAQDVLISELSLAFGPSVGDDFLPDLPISLIHGSSKIDTMHRIAKRQTPVNESESADYEDSEYGGDDAEDEKNKEAELTPTTTAPSSSLWTDKTLEQHKLPAEVMLGVNRNEGSYFLQYLDPLMFGSEPRNMTREDSLAFISKQFNFLSPHMIKVLTDLFLQDIRGADSNTARQSLSEFIADSTFTCPATLFAHLISRLGVKTFFYLFDHKTSISQAPDWMGVMHFDEVAFVFGLPLRQSNLYSAEEVQLSKHIMTSWVNFAATGSPNGEGYSHEGLERVSSSSSPPVNLRSVAKKEGEEVNSSMSQVKWNQYSEDEPWVMLLKSGKEGRMMLREGVRHDTCSKWSIILENS